VVYTGPTRSAEQIAALAALPDYEVTKKKGKHHKAAGSKTAEAKQDGTKESNKEGKKAGNKAVTKPAQRKPASGKTTGLTEQKATAATAPLAR
jgi:hypothetical protein